MPSKQPGKQYFIKMKAQKHLKIWGGNKLSSLFPEKNDQVNQEKEMQKIGEISFHPENPNINFPLILKLIDAAEDLSIQVHPKKEDLKYFHQKDQSIRSKEESWIILDHKTGAEISLGLKKNTDEKEIRHSIKAANFENLLQKYTIKTKEIYHVPPGTIHTIGAGVFLLEIQQDSQTTFRIYDFDRQSLDGKKRPLHLKDALYSLKYNVSTQESPVEKTEHKLLSTAQEEQSIYTHNSLLQAENYSIEELKIHGSVDIELNQKFPVLFFISDGEVQFKSNVESNVENYTLSRYSALLIDKDLTKLKIYSQKTSHIYLFCVENEANIIKVSPNKVIENLLQKR